MPSNPEECLDIAIKIGYIGFIEEKPHRAVLFCCEFCQKRYKNNMGKYPLTIARVLKLSDKIIIKNN